MKNLTLSLCVMGASLALASCAAPYSAKSLPPGQYTNTQKSTNAQGTETTQKTQANVYYDQYGNKRAIERTDTSRDPKGLFNKSTSTSTTSY